MVSLIEAGADIHVASGNGYTPLMQAVDVCAFELVEFLIQKGAFINFAGREGVTPLHIAVDLAVESFTENFSQESKDRFCMVDLLVRYGANTRQKNDFGESPIDWAFKSGEKQITELLGLYEAEA